MVGKIRRRKAATAEKKEVQEKKSAIVVDESSSSSEKSAPPKPTEVVSKVIPKKVAEKSEVEAKKEEKKEVPAPQNNKGESEAEAKKEEKKEVPAPQKNKRQRVQVHQGASKKSKKEEKQPSEDEDEDVDADVDEKQETPLKLYVSVDSPLTETQLRQFFIQSETKISSVRITELKGEKANKWGYIFVTFATLKDAQKALTLSGKAFKGKKITVEIPKKSKKIPKAKKDQVPRPPPPKDCKKVILRGLTTESDIHELFQDFWGDIAEIKPYVQRVTGETKSHFVYFNTHDSVLKALELKNSKINGKKVNIAYSVKTL